MTHNVVTTTKYTVLFLCTWAHSLVRRLPNATCELFLQLPLIKDFVSDRPGENGRVTEGEGERGARLSSLP